MLGRLRSRAYRQAITDRLDGINLGEPVPAGGGVQRRLNHALFAGMGRLAKMDGRVSEEEIAFASELMDKLGLGQSERHNAIDSFDLGKRADTDVMALLRRALPYIGGGSRLARLILKTLCQLTYSKGCMRLKEKLMLRELSGLLGFDNATLLTLCTEIQVRDSVVRLRGGRSLSHAYRVLQLKPGADDREIRRAYRRLMTRYHPDKLARTASGTLALRQAQENFHAVRQAYETISVFRKTVNP